MPRYPPPPSIPSHSFSVCSYRPNYSAPSDRNTNHSLCPRVADLLRGGKVSSVNTTPHHTTPIRHAHGTNAHPWEVVCADHLMRFATRVARIQKAVLSKECGEGKGVSRSSWPAVYIFFGGEGREGDGRRKAVCYSIS
jgi:hypothetical protein